MVKYLYGMRLRPFGIGCQPKEGLIGCERIETVNYYNVISYDRPLTEQEKRQYDLDFIERRGQYDVDFVERRD